MSRLIFTPLFFSQNLPLYFYHCQFCRKICGQECISVGCVPPACWLYPVVSNVCVCGGGERSAHPFDADLTDADTPMQHPWCRFPKTHLDEAKADPTLQRQTPSLQRQTPSLKGRPPTCKGPLWTEWQTDACENITFPKHRLQCGKNARINFQLSFNAECHRKTYRRHQSIKPDFIT